jgi:hypothetical protein
MVSWVHIVPNSSTSHYTRPKATNIDTTVLTLTTLYWICIRTTYSIAFKPAESGWGAGSKYSQKFDDIFKSKNNSSTDKEIQLENAHSTTMTSQMQDKSNDEIKKKSWNIPREILWILSLALLGTQVQYSTEDTVVWDMIVSYCTRCYVTIYKGILSTACYISLVMIGSDFHCLQ